jgi:hypothetical protein
MNEVASALIPLIGIPAVYAIILKVWLSKVKDESAILTNWLNSYDGKFYPNHNRATVDEAHNVLLWVASKKLRDTPNRQNVLSQIQQNKRDGINYDSTDDAIADAAETLLKAYHRFIENLPQILEDEKNRRAQLA